MSESSTNKTKDVKMTNDTLTNHIISEGTIGEIVLEIRNEISGWDWFDVSKKLGDEKYKWFTTIEYQDQSKGYYLMLDLDIKDYQHLLAIIKNEWFK